MGISRRGLFRRTAVVAAVVLAPASVARGMGDGTAVTVKTKVAAAARDAQLAGASREAQLIDYAPRTVSRGFVYMAPPSFRPSVDLAPSQVAELRDAFQAQWRGDMHDRVEITSFGSRHREFLMPDYSCQCASCRRDA